MKLQSSRIIDVGDVSKMLGWNSDEEIDAVRRVIARWNPDDSADLELMIMLGRLEREEP